MRARSAGNDPAVLDVGELRDRIFALADKARVKLRQVFVMPTSKGREANAAAAVGNMVLLNDYLLQHLTKREVDAVVAHELAHLRQRHPGRLQIWLGMLIPVFSASLVFLDPSLLRWMGIRARGPLVEVICRSVPIVVASVIVLILMARRRSFERQADAGAVQMTGDAEAIITALAKLARLNLMPLEWSRWEEGLLTHPAMSRRLRAVARRGGLTEERLQEILATSDTGQDRYPLPAVLGQAGRIFSGSFKRTFAFRFLWTSHLLTTLTPALVAALVPWVGNQDVAPWLFYFAGLLVTAVVTTLLCDWLAFRSHGQLRSPLLAKLEREGIMPEALGGILIGFAPAAVPRIYEGLYDWDRGFLFLFGGRLCYVGEQARFALRQDQVHSLNLGPGPPAWVWSRRIYLAWRDAEHGREGVFNLQVSQPRLRIQLRKQVHALHGRLQDWWQKQAARGDPPAPLADLTTPEIGTVTGLSPRFAAKPSVFFRLLFPRLLLAVGFSVLFGLPFSLQEGGAGWYAPVVAFLITTFNVAPYWFYREPTPPAGMVA